MEEVIFHLLTATTKKLKVYNNYASSYGGGLSIFGYSFPLVENTFITNNSSEGGYKL